MNTAAERAKRLHPPSSYVWEALAAQLCHYVHGFRNWYRRRWFYRRLLSGQLCDSIALAPHDVLPRHLDDADAILRGQFTFCGQMVEAHGESIFDIDPPSDAWEDELHAFAWLPSLAALGSRSARACATQLMAQWVDRFDRYSEPAFLPQIMARRLMRIFAHGRFVIVNSDLMWRSAQFVSLREQVRLLARISGEAPDGLPRIEVAAALALSGLCLADTTRMQRLEQGLVQLKTELKRQILADGGHIGRSPETLVHTYRLSLMVSDALRAKGFENPDFLSETEARMARAIRFFRHGDGLLAAFNGGTESDQRMIAWLLLHEEKRPKTVATLENSGYQRLSAGHTLCLVDCGTPPPGNFAVDAHAGTLAFELSSGAQRIVVNCGSARPGQQAGWIDPLKATAAHSSIVVHDTSNAMVLADGWMREALGPRLYHGAENLIHQQDNGERGHSITIGHDGYIRLFGIQLERELTISHQGLALSGRDHLIVVRKAREVHPFAIRFHIHPDVRLSRAKSGDILLKLSNGEGWRFRASVPVEIEESIYFSGADVRRTEQLVLNGKVAGSAVEVRWQFEQIGGA